MRIPSGAKRDLMIINLAIGLIRTSLNNDDDVKHDKYLTKRDNKSYKLNKRIDRNLERLATKLQETQTKVYDKYGKDGKLGKWAKSYLNTKMINIFNKMQKDTNLELLANQVLFECFIERDKPLIEEYKWLTETKEYAVFDLLVETHAGKVVESTYLDAQMIKGIVL